MTKLSVFTQSDSSGMTKLEALQATLYATYSAFFLPARFTQKPGFSPFLF